VRPSQVAAVRRGQDRPAISNRQRCHRKEDAAVIVLGVVLLLIGFIANISILWTLGIIVLVIGLALALLGGLGHAVGGRRHYF
jgi:uncharacterized membrane protein HdeD (DUF308 family)